MFQILTRQFLQALASGLTLPQAGGTWGEAAGLDCSRYVSGQRPEPGTPPSQTFPSKPAQELSLLPFPVFFCLSDPAGRGPEHILACTLPNPTPRAQSFCET